MKDFLGHGITGFPKGAGEFHLSAAMLNAVFDYLQLADLSVDDGKLFLQGADGAVQCVMFHMLLNFVQRKTDFFHDQNGVQRIQLAPAVIAVAIVRIHVGRAEQTDFVVVNQCLSGNVLEFGELPNGKELIHYNPLDLIVSIQFMIQERERFFKEVVKMKSRIAAAWNGLAEGITVKKLVLIMAGAMICSFGIHNIHQRTNITEGGVIGLMLLIEHWLEISPAYITPVLDLSCYLLAWKYLGGQFIKVSIISTSCISAFYKVWEMFPPMLPDLSDVPLAAAVLGGLFVGIGVGLIVRQGGSSGGDDALALTISRVTCWRLSRAYLFTDLTVLALSLTYIPARRIVFSLVTVTISSYLIDWIKSWGMEAAVPADS